MERTNGRFLNVKDMHPDVGNGISKAAYAFLEEQDHQDGTKYEIVGDGEVLQVAAVEEVSDSVRCVRGVWIMCLKMPHQVRSYVMPIAYLADHEEGMGFPKIKHLIGREKVRDRMGNLTVAKMKEDQMRFDNFDAIKDKVLEKMREPWEYVKSVRLPE